MEKTPLPQQVKNVSKKALYTATKLYIIFQEGGGRAPTLASTVDAHAWEGGANYVSIITVEVNCAKYGNLHMHKLFIKSTIFDTVANNLYHFSLWYHNDTTCLLLF